MTQPDWNTTPPTPPPPPAWQAYGLRQPQPVYQTEPGSYQQDVPPPPPTPWFRRRRNQLLLAVGVLVVALAVVLPLTLLGGTPEQTLTIGVGLIDSDSGGNCESGGTGGYSDVSPGMPITVEDENHKVLASTSLPDHGYEKAGADLGCVWKMKVKVPGDRQQYGVTAGRRGTVTFDRSELVGNKWEAVLSMGDGAN